MPRLFHRLIEEPLCQSLRLRRKTLEHLSKGTISTRSLNQKHFLHDISTTTSVLSTKLACFHLLNKMVNSMEWPSLTKFGDVSLNVVHLLLNNFFLPRLALTQYRLVIIFISYFSEWINTLTVLELLGLEVAGIELMIV